MRAGRRNLVGLICAALVLLTLFFLTGLFEKLPMAVLAGIVIVAGIGLFALDDFKALWRIRRSEFWLGAATRRLGARARDARRHRVRHRAVDDLARCQRSSGRTPPSSAVSRAPTRTATSTQSRDAERIPGLLIYRIDDELFFANAAHVIVSDITAASSTPTHPQPLS